MLSELVAVSGVLSWRLESGTCVLLRLRAAGLCASCVSVCLCLLSVRVVFVSVFFLVVGVLAPVASWFYVLSGCSCS